ncbi:MAG TPA: hypothetical protein VF173_32750 [Thermoanaerobaculia bacterium]|nr:hypothetical protein [Thermoanaerobaculia bacterium]
MAHRGIAALALVLMLTLLAQPAAAAERQHPTHRTAGFWTAVLAAVPGAQAVVHTLNNWFHLTDDATSAPPDGSEKGWGIDPNGNSLTGNLGPITVPGGQ